MEKVCQVIMDETKGADFGDKRLPSRFSQLLYNLSHAPDKSIPSSNKGWIFKSKTKCVHFKC